MRVQKAFTLVEVLVVVLLLGILAAIVLPKFSNASATARASMLADHLRIFRSQIEVFKGQHRGVAPGYPNCDVTGNPTEAAFITYMTMASDSAGATAAPGTPGYRYGPYLREIPENSVNGLTTVQMVPDGAAFPGAPDDSHGWVYQPSTNTFKADTAGSDGNATPYFDY